MKANRKGRSKGAIRGRFVAMTHDMIDSAAWRSLSGAAAKVYLDLARLYDGKNNGDLAYGLGTAAERLALGKATVQRALKELMTKGFIRQESRGGWRGRQSSTWALTSLATADELRSDDWKRWQPGEAEMAAAVDG
jgi:predicted transcriptional regulator